MMFTRVVLRCPGLFLMGEPTFCSDPSEVPPPAWAVKARLGLEQDRGGLGQRLQEAAALHIAYVRKLCLFITFTLCIRKKVEHLSTSYNKDPDETFRRLRYRMAIDRMHTGAHRLSGQ